MSSATLHHPQPSSHTVHTVADLVAQLGNVPLERIRMQPPLGTANVDDVLHVNEVERESKCELIDGVLVEKAMSHFEAVLAAILVTELQLYMRRNRIGKVYTDGALYKLIGPQFRIPDVTVCLNDKFPDGKLRRIPYAKFAPDLAVEILSEGNTPQEIARKRKELFDSGTRLMWVIDPQARTVDVFTSAENKTTLAEQDTLTGGDLLPGFELSIHDWFHEAEQI